MRVCVCDTHTGHTMTCIRFFLPPLPLLLWQECGGKPFQDPFHGYRVWAVKWANTRKDFGATAELMQDPTCKSGTSSQAPSPAAAGGVLEDLINLIKRLLELGHEGQTAAACWRNKHSTHTCPSKVHDSIVVNVDINLLVPLSHYSPKCLLLHCIWSSFTHTRL
jgi:hypothetical protein